MNDLKRKYLKYYELIKEELLQVEIQEVSEMMIEKKKEIEDDLLKLEDSFSFEQMQAFIDCDQYIKELNDFIIENYCEENSKSSFQVKSDLSENENDLFSIQSYFFLICSVKLHIWNEIQNVDSDIRQNYDLLWGK